MFKTDKVAPFKAVCDWLHDEHKVPRQEHFDEIVANIYSRPANQCIGAHTDQNPLLGETSDILSLSMGAAGVFFWHPSLTGQLRGWNAKEAARHATERAAGLWGCVPLLPGDLFLATGTFQKHLVHGALSYRDAANVDGVLSKWSTCSDARRVLESAEYREYFDETVPQEDRSVMTFRRIVNHRHDCPELVRQSEDEACVDVAKMVRSFSVGSASSTVAPLAEWDPKLPKSESVWAHPKGPTQEERAVAALELDRQRPFFARDASSTVAPLAPEEVPAWDPQFPESRGVFARPVFRGGATQEERAAAPELERGDRQQHDVIPKAENTPTPPSRSSHGQDTSDASAPRPKLRLVQQPQLTPRLPQPRDDDAVSPKEVGQEECEEQVEEAEKFMRSCREKIGQLEDMLEGAQPDTHVEIHQLLVELTTKMRDCARVQNIAECRLEVAAPLYLIFKMIIPVM